MPPLPSQQPLLGFKPRVVCYFQTYHDNGEYVSMLPLLTNNSGCTHIILSAVHINWDPENLTLNDDSPNHSKYTELWDEAMVLQDSGIKILCMLGGAAKGSFARLDYSESRTDIPLARFEAYYHPLKKFIQSHNFDGIDLDIEEEMSLPGVVHLIDRLRADFGQNFLITLAPVATALMAGRPHLSGFDYRLLEAARGRSISWYNAQFYNGWGGLNNTAAYDEVMRNGWPAHKIVAGMLTNPRHGGSGYVPLELTSAVLGALIEKYPSFGGVMGWEYWNSFPQTEKSWEWCFCMTLCMGMKKLRDAAIVVSMGRSLSSVNMNRS